MLVWRRCAVRIHLAVLKRAISSPSKVRVSRTKSPASLSILFAIPIGNWVNKGKADYRSNKAGYRSATTNEQRVTTFLIMISLLHQIDFTTFFATKPSEVPKAIAVIIYNIWNLRSEGREYIVHHRRSLSPERHQNCRFENCWNGYLL